MKTRSAVTRRHPPSFAVTATLLVSATFACVCTPDGQDDKNDKGISGSSPAASFALDTDVARADLGEFTSEPHPFGSERQAQLGTWLEGRITASGGRAVREAFTADVPNPAALEATGPVAQTLSKSGANIYALDVAVKDAPCVVALASHYDSKDIPGLRYVGANDSGSSSAAMLQQVAWLNGASAGLDLTCDVIAVWFDAEEALLRDWTDGQKKHPAKIQDNTYGSRHAAGRLTQCTYAGADARCLPPDLGGRPLVALVLMDMIGSPALQLSRDSYSSDSLLALAVAGADTLGAKGVFSKEEIGVQDDHIPFRNAGIPVINLIDFNNLDYGHKAGDEAANVSVESMQTAARIALHVALTVAKTPSVATP